MLAPDEIAALRRVALEALRAKAAGAPPPPPPLLPAALARPGAAFVTLRRGGELRGCVGHLHATQPLWRSVQEMAAEAAEDSRFEPVAPDEVDGLSVDISILSPMERVADPATVEVGRDGLYIRRDGRSGLLLPQVAVEQGWDRVRFLDETCRKAGLPPGAWRDPATEVWRFQVEMI